MIVTLYASVPTGSLNPLYNVEQFAQSAMRNAIGSMDFDRILQARQELNNEVKAALDLAARPWGIKILRCVQNINNITRRKRR